MFTGAVLLIFVVRADPKDLPVMWDAFVRSGMFGSVWKIILASVTLGSVFCLIWQSSTHKNEISRLAKERDLLQNKLFEILDERRNK